SHKIHSLRACLLVYYASRGKIIPRQYQLEANNALEDRRDTRRLGVGSGKTLCQIIPNPMHPCTTSMSIFPLERLQMLQAAEFHRWGIDAVCINEDTPNYKDLWERIEKGQFQHLIVQPQQQRSYNGHLTRLARLINNTQFAKTIARVHIDEVHFHYIAGLPRHGLPAFRPAWGSLNELRLRLPKNTPLQALSGTLPPHIKAAVIDHLNFDPSTFLSLKLSTNRSDKTYATHHIVGSLSDFRNLDFLISSPYTPPRKTVVYHDDAQQCTDASTHLYKRLHLLNTGIVRHHHAGMSKAYLKAVFDDFSRPDGICQILNGTDMIDYGVPQHQVTSLQRAGRGGRRGQASVYLLMAEPWAYTISLDTLDPLSTDPDRPISGRLLKNARKIAHTGLAM
ncbi:hypothetical protein C8R46DRAFT_1331015, partial [Mycena filopes]